MTEARAKLRESFFAALGDMGTEDADRSGPPVRVFRAHGLPGMRFELRSIATAPPPSAAVSMMYLRDENGNYGKAGVACFEAGVWKRYGGKPLEGDFYWTLMVSERG